MSDVRLPEWATETFGPVMMGEPGFTAHPVAGRHSVSESGHLMAGLFVIKSDGFTDLFCEWSRFGWVSIERSGVCCVTRGMGESRGVVMAFRAIDRSEKGGDEK